MGGSTAPTPKFERTMFFIDGGYLRLSMKELYGDDKIDYKTLRERLSSETIEGGIQPYLIRAYYYDAIPIEQSDPVYNTMKEYAAQIKDAGFYTIRLARLKQSNKQTENDADDCAQKRYKQKGVDVLLAIDMLQKAYENQYEWAMLLTGDDDFIDLVEAVKNTGKRVYGFYFEKHTSKELQDSFDKKIVITKQLADTFHTK